jgi:hypothetical protein
MENPRILHMYVIPMFMVVRHSAKVFMCYVHRPFFLSSETLCVKERSKIRKWRRFIIIIGNTISLSSQYKIKILHSEQVYSFEIQQTGRRLSHVVDPEVFSFS